MASDNITASYLEFVFPYLPHLIPPTEIKSWENIPCSCFHNWLHAVHAVSIIVTLLINKCFSEAESYFYLCCIIIQIFQVIQQTALFYLTAVF